MAKAQAKEVAVMSKEELFKILATFTDEDKAQFKAIMGLNVTAKQSSGVRVTGKVQRTEKELTERVARQMEILIKVLPTDRAIDINEWAKLATAGGLTTQQPPERIAAYYKTSIIEKGYAIVIG